MRMTNAMQAALYWARKHIRFGPNMGPAFVPGGTGYTVANADANHIATFGTGSLRFQGTTLIAFAVSVANAFVVGQTYELTIICSTYTSGSVIFNTLGSQVFAGPVGTIKIRGVATSTSFSMVQNVANTDITFASIDIRQVTA